MTHEVTAELVGTVHSLAVDVGDVVDAGATIIIMESMKMEIPVQTEHGGIVRELAVVVGDNVRDGDVLAVIEENS